MVSPHISDENLELLALDRLPDAAAAPAEEHLLVCAECRERLAGWDEYVRAMRAAAGEL
jgi:anti-sigma factor RsiW